MEMSFLWRAPVLSFRNWLKSSVIQKELRVEPLLLHLKRSQSRYYEYLTRISPGWGIPGMSENGKRAWGRLWTCWRDFYLGNTLVSCWRRWPRGGRSGCPCCSMSWGGSDWMDGVSSAPFAIFFTLRKLCYIRLHDFCSCLQRVHGESICSPSKDSAPPLYALF